MSVREAVKPEAEGQRAKLPIRRASVSLDEGVSRASGDSPAAPVTTQETWSEPAKPASWRSARRPHLTWPQIVLTLTASFILIQLATGVRFLVHLVNADPANGWVQAVIRLDDVLVAPFDGIVSNGAITFGPGQLDLAALLALVCYPLLLLLFYWAVDASGILDRD